MKHSHWYLIAFASVAIAEGAIQQLLYAHADAFRIALAITIFPYAILLYLWATSDAAERGVRMPPGASLLVPFIAIVGVPYYLLRTRPRIAALWQLLFAILFALSLNFISWGGSLLIYAFQRR